MRLCPRGCPGECLARNTPALGINMTLGFGGFGLGSVHPSALTSYWSLRCGITAKREYLPCIFISSTGGGGFRDGNISLWEISYFKCVRNFPLNFQATVRNKPGAKFSRAKNSSCKIPPPPLYAFALISALFLPALPLTS